ncbi:hypothetical protein H4W31_001927 [Plantactinospora soyae]|uniref:Uncharacterized protein n=1 Tax=Plantactinospora soyae TaxID=1544732 RepID=A0A927M284_9ACTN|nr:hypothetical protein [Plantactinospora soyae]
MRRWQRYWLSGLEGQSHPSWWPLAGLAPPPEECSLLHLD